MSSQPNEKAPDVPDALVKELLRSQGLPLDAHVKLNVHTTRVRVNPDGSRTILSDSGFPAGRRPTSRRRPPAWAALLFSLIGFVQMSFGMWAWHSDSLATPLLHGSESCQLAQVMAQHGTDGTVTLQAAAPPSSALAACRIESAVVTRRYTSSSRHVTHYHVATVTPTGRRDDIPVAGRAGSQLWSRVQPTERITLQRFVLPGYHLSGDVIALADSAGAAMSRYHPDSNYQNNLVNVLAGGLLFVLGMVMFVKSRPDA